MKLKKPHGYAWIGVALMHPLASLAYYPQRLLDYIRPKGGWKVIELDDDAYLAENATARLRITRPHLWELVREYPVWERDFASLDFSDKTVLDVGAGCGETAYFFFRHGAKRVIAVEKDSKAARNLWANSMDNGWDMEVINEPFRLEHLGMSFDLCKIDIEGDEVALLELHSLPPIVLESHTDEITAALLARFPDLGVISKHPVYQTAILSNRIYTGRKRT